MTAGMAFPYRPAAARAALERRIASNPELAGAEARAGPLPRRTRAPGIGRLPGGLAGFVSA
jgi:hypothetical protein